MLISKKHLDLYKPEVTVLIEQRLNSIIESKAERESRGTTVFLSHNHRDEDILKKVITLFKDLQVNVYLDWQDEEMPISTSGETAIKIKDKIIENKKFILLATNAAIESKWCNWELGFGDAKKYHENIAIMPITEDNGNWIGNEYLQIYPTIKTDYEIFKGDYYVEFNDERVKFVDWLKTR